MAIGVAVRHFSYYISQSTQRARVLTDSRPCTLAYKKLKRGEYSTSPKVTTFLSLAARFNVEILYISAENNIFTDFMSRNPVKCDEDKCRICEYVQHTSTASIGQVKVEDILSGSSRVPFASAASWVGVQQSCLELQEVLKYTTTGASIPKKKRNATDIRRYLNCGVQATSTPNGKLLIVKQPSPFKQTIDRIVIPRKAADGLLTAIHIQLDHCGSSANQLKQVFSRAFFCLDMDSKARAVVDNCHTCVSLKTITSSYHQQSTSTASETIGSKFSADVLKRFSQNILVIREDIT